MVDPAREYPHADLPFAHWCHMAADTGFDELHAFAAALGVPRRAFQRDHYDLPAHVRELAVAAGAEEVSTRELIVRMAGPRGDRARRRAAPPAQAQGDPAQARGDPAQAQGDPAQAQGDSPL